MAKFLPCKETFENFVTNHIPYYADQGAYQTEPFRIWGDLYYVGDKKVCMHLLNTGDGLILFDSGYPNTYEYLLSSIRKLGFDPKDIRYVIHSHGHFDHFGNGDLLRRDYGCQILMSQVDTQLLREMPSRALCHLGPNDNDDVCWPDGEIQDGDIIALGNKKILCRLAPGHTFGTLAFFFDVEENGKTRRVGYWGGVGMLTMYKDYCREMGLPQTKCEVMRSTIAMLRRESVDITLGNHPAQNFTMEKRARMLEQPGINPFLDANEWPGLLNRVEANLNEFESLGY